MVPSFATSTLRTARDRDRTGDGDRSSCARFTARYVAAAAPNAPMAAAIQVRREGTIRTVASSFDNMSLVLPDFNVPADAIDFGDPNTWPETDLEREAMFAKMRRERPISFHSEPEFESFPAGPGYWSLVKYDDVLFASRNPELPG